MKITDAVRAPCGCVFGTIGDTFVIEPCSETCEVYAYAHEQSRKQGKPITEVKPLQDSGQLPFQAHCPYCGKAADGFAGTDARPEPGDRAICVYCVKIGIYTEHGIRKPTAEEAAEHDHDPQMLIMRETARKVSHRLRRLPPE